MANVTITIEGEIDEVVATLRGMAGRDAGTAAGVSSSGSATATADLPVADASETPGADASAFTSAPTDEAASEPSAPEASEPEPASAVWNASYVNTFWRNLSETAREAMLRVSRSPNHTQKRAQLMHTLRLSQRELSGSLSSQGHSLNRLKRRRGNVDLPRPLTYDRVEDAYMLDANFANALRELGMN